eukprot:gnl/Chilomastix_cuspidata/4179.p2 GENE.gnl/Chilomastix_cuspidata/4179~~gnl/Chilomastix_cuspidata/4179.p2  ORF type:complete len:120 (+),score=50.96 gnl/Chilomastix_cuspidata/4179:195-554(+)
MDLDPTEEEVERILEEIEEDEPTGYVFYNRLAPVVCRMYSGSEITKVRPEDLLRAFHILDAERLGELDFQELQSMLTTSGDRFSMEEVQNMQEFCMNPSTGSVDYASYVAYIATDKGPY